MDEGNTHLGRLQLEHEGLAFVGAPRGARARHDRLERLHERVEDREHHLHLRDAILAVGDAERPRRVGHRLDRLLCAQSEQRADVAHKV